MADQEITKHTKKIYKIWNSKEHSFRHKLQDFLIEIFIIVFAVSLSIWLHDKSEHNHQQKEVKEFLVGLKEDLSADIKEMEEDKKAYVKQGLIFKYITGVQLRQALNNDSLQKYQTWLFNTTRLQQNNGRYEGFKSSGRIGTIEDKTLQNNIMDLYQELIPGLLSSTDAYIRRKTQLFDYGIKNRQRITDSTTNLAVILLSDEAQNLCTSLAMPEEILNRYDDCINKMKLILTELYEK